MEDDFDDFDEGGKPNWKKREEAWEKILGLYKQLDEEMCQCLHISRITEGSFGLNRARDKLRESGWWARKEFKGTMDDWP